MKYDYLSLQYISSKHIRQERRTYFRCCFLGTALSDQLIKYFIRKESRLPCTRQNALGSVLIGCNGDVSLGQIAEFLCAQWTHSRHFFLTHFSPPYIQNRWLNFCHVLFIPLCPWICSHTSQNFVGIYMRVNELLGKSDSTRTSFPSRVSLCASLIANFLLNAIKLDLVDGKTVGNSFKLL